MDTNTILPLNGKLIHYCLHIFIQLKRPDSGHIELTMRNTEADDTIPKQICEIQSKEIC